LVPGFRQTINFSFAGFHTYCIVGEHPGNILLGPAEMTFVPEGDNYVSYQSAEKRRFLDRFHQVKLYYGSSQTAKVSCSIDKKMSQSELPPVAGIGQAAWTCDTAKNVKFSFSGGANLHIYGAAFDDSTGIYVDNFSVRGNTGLGLQNADSTLFSNFDSLRHYDAIFLEYGLNIASANSKDFDYYEKGMIKSINRLKKLYPKTSIILMGVGDRSTRKNGEFVTMESIPLLIESQRKIAQSTGIAFWDLFTAMGGENSMPNFVNASPPMANKDYTHLTFAGGRKIGKILAETIFFEHKRYDHLHQQPLP
jgi:lysophospholipase L1-like esterase